MGERSRSDFSVAPRAQRFVAALKRHGSDAFSVPPAHLTRPAASPRIRPMHDTSGQGSTAGSRLR